MELHKFKLKIVIAYFVSNPYKSLENITIKRYKFNKKTK